MIRKLIWVVVILVVVVGLGILIFGGGSDVPPEGGGEVAPQGSIGDLGVAEEVVDGVIIDDGDDVDFGELI